MAAPLPWSCSGQGQSLECDCIHNDTGDCVFCQNSHGQILTIPTDIHHVVYDPMVSLNPWLVDLNGLFLENDENSSKKMQIPTFIIFVNMIDTV